jgi:hypothetical protein
VPYLYLVQNEWLFSGRIGSFCPKASKSALQEMLYSMLTVIQSDLTVSGVGVDKAKEMPCC